MSAYYNDSDPKVCAWLRELIKAGLITNGVVDERPIQEVRPEDLAGFTRVHLFAGIAGWDYALQLAGWPSDVPVWTGSCPCQPFSCAGRQRGLSDERHLWPVMRELIAKCSPPVVFGEQVASKAGREWLYPVRSEMETLGYAFGAADLCAASVQAEHIRQRLLFVAYSVCEGLERLHQARRRICLQPASSNVRGIWKATPRVLPRANGFSRKLDAPPFYKHQISGYGNSIVPQLAAEFIQASVEALNDY